MMEGILTADELIKEEMKGSNFSPTIK